MFKKIIIPLDGSGSAEKAVAYATHIASGTDAELHLVCVCSLDQQSAYVYPPDMIESELHRQRSYLTRVQSALAEHGWKVYIHSLEGHPVRVVVSLAENVGADLLVLTSHGRTGMKRFLLGSVAENIARQSPCPVLIVGHESRGAEILQCVVRGALQAHSVPA